MKKKLIKSLVIKKTFLLFIFTCLSLSNIVKAQSTDPNRGTRVDWMRGALGILWLPENTYGGNIEGVSIEPFIDQIKDLKTLDFVQIGLASPFIYSPTHMAPHPIIESLWQGDTNISGDPINLVVPRAKVADPFLSYLKALRAAGLKTEVYINSSNLLTFPGQTPPVEFADFSDRWKNYCDTNPDVQAFLASKSYHFNGTHDDRRPYMFCYAEFILKEYAIRYGDLIDAWCIDASHANIQGGAGDIPSSLNVEDQRVYEAFANAIHAGNPNAGVTFNNGIGNRDSNPFLPYLSPSLFEDYKFGHPFGGAGNMVVPREPLYRVNFGICEFMRDTEGLPYKNDGIAGNDNVVAHFFPKQSTTSWNDGGTPCLTDEEFVQWNNVGLINGGGISWGTPLRSTNLNLGANLILQEYALRQLSLVDADLSVNQYPGAPNWARSYTILPEAYAGEPYSHTLTEGKDFWDPEGDNIISLLIEGGGPAWLTITETEPGVWTLSGLPNETTPTDHEFDLSATDANNMKGSRSVVLKVIENRAPIWLSGETILPQAYQGQSFSHTIKENVDFSDEDGDPIVSLLAQGNVPSWLSITGPVAGVWTLSGTPNETIPTDYEFDLQVNDATGGSNRTVTLSVAEFVAPSRINAVIKPTGATNYGIGNIATMYSEILTAPDGLATFRVSVDVTPTNTLSVISGISGGTSSITSWGVGNGTNANSDDIFTGSDNEWVESIGNIQIIDFNPNGGDLSLDNVSAFFEIITIENSQSGQDRVSLEVDGAITNLGKSSNNVENIDLELATSVENITEFSIGVGNDSTTNKWSVGGITVVVDFENTPLSINEETAINKAFKLYPNPTSNTVLFNMDSQSVKVYDIRGKLLKTDESGSRSLDVSGLHSGIYIVKFLTKDGVLIIRKLVKKED